MKFLLFIIAIILKLIFGIIGYVFGTVVSLYKKKWNDWHSDLSESLDQYGNTLCKYLFNALLIKKDGYSFGNIDETISSCIGKNYEKNTLTTLGKFLDCVLDGLDKNHSVKSIDSTIK